MHPSAHLDLRCVFPSDYEITPILASWRSPRANGGGHRVGRRDGAVAHEAAADVGRRCAVDERARREQRHAGRVRRTGDDHRAACRYPPRAVEEVEALARDRDLQRARDVRLGRGEPVAREPGVAAQQCARALQRRFGGVPVAATVVGQHGRGEQRRGQG